jgi:hypothetical protein
MADKDRAGRSGALEALCGAAVVPPAAATAEAGQGTAADLARGTGNLRCNASLWGRRLAAGKHRVALQEALLIGRAGRAGTAVGCKLREKLLSRG